MTRKPALLPPQVQVWVDARRRYGLSHAQVAMARELGLNPRKFGQLANHRQEPWKAPLPLFIEHLYLERFGRERPEVVVPVEERHRQEQRKKAARGPRESLGQNRHFSRRSRTTRRSGELGRRDRPEAWSRS